MLLFETRVFNRRVYNFLTEESYQEFREELAERPGLGSIIHGSGGIRKIRWSAMGRGKRGGVRIIYYWATSQDEILLLLIYAKNEQDDLSKDQLKRLRKLVEETYP